MPFYYADSVEIRAPVGAESGDALVAPEPPRLALPTIPTRLADLHVRASVFTRKLADLFASSLHNEPRI